MLCKVLILIRVPGWCTERLISSLCALGWALAKFAGFLFFFFFFFRFLFLFLFFLFLFLFLFFLFLFLCQVIWARSSRKT